QPHFQRRVAVPGRRPRASDAARRVSGDGARFTELARALTATMTRTDIDVLLADPLATSRERGEGVGFVGPDVPIDVLLATGKPFGHLPWQAAGATAWADQWLESSFPFWARSILEQWHLGAFDALETVVFTRADDASQRLYYYVAELKRRGKLGGPAAHIFDVALVPRGTSLGHTEQAGVDLMRQIGRGAA